MTEATERIHTHIHCAVLLTAIRGRWHYYPHYTDEELKGGEKEVMLELRPRHFGHMLYPKHCATEFHYDP